MKYIILLMLFLTSNFCLAGSQTFTDLASEQHITITPSASGLKVTETLPSGGSATFSVTPDSHGHYQIADLSGIINLNPKTGDWTNGPNDGGHINPVPEPEEYAMMLLGLPLIGWVARRNTKLQAA